MRLDRDGRFRFTFLAGVLSQPFRSMRPNRPKFVGCGCFPRGTVNTNVVFCRDGFAPDFAVEEAQNAYG